MTRSAIITTGEPTTNIGLRRSESFGCAQDRLSKAVPYHEDEPGG